MKKETKGAGDAPTKPTKPKITAKNLLKPEGLWMAAIGQWEEGLPDLVSLRLRADDEIPAFAREWLACAMAGEVKKRRGKKKHYPSIDETMSRLRKKIEIRNFFGLQMLIERLSEHPAPAGTPKERAIDTCAEKFGLTEDEVSHIVYPRK